MQSLRTFLRDDRAVAPVVGFVLLFGIGVIAFSGYQAVQVPQQNAETEFQHYENVQNDLIVVRNAISRAGQQNQSQFESVRLGTQYRERALALNPPDPVGTLRTSEGYNITLDNGTTERNVTTRFLEYQNGYNELEIEPIYYENSVLYLDAESGQRVFFEDQNLVRDRDNGSTVVITALQREFSQSATGRVTLELYPTDGGASLPDGEVNVTLPTRLLEDYWRGELDDGDADEEDLVTNFSYNNRTDPVNQVSFNVTSEELEFNTVGINNEPDRDDSVSEMGARGGPETVSEVFPLEYDDESNAPAPQNDSIPPANPKGTLQGFNNLQADNGARAQLSESNFGNPNFADYQMNIGLAFRNIASGDHNITIDYQTGTTGETFTLEVIDASGDEIDSETDYMLDSNSMTTKTITLSTAESDYIDSNEEVYIRIFDNDRGGGRNGDDTQSSLFIDFTSVNN